VAVEPSTFERNISTQQQQTANNCSREVTFSGSGASASASALGLGYYCAMLEPFGELLALRRESGGTVSATFARAEDRDKFLQSFPAVVVKPQS